MKQDHIIGILENAPLAQLSKAELASVRAHAASCVECLRAFEAARVASTLLNARAAEAFEPSPFFQTRVLAALREQRAAEETPALQKLWRTAGALFYSMTATVALLAALTFVIPSVQTTETTGEVATASDPYSTDAALLAPEDAADEDANFDQVLKTIYASGDEAQRP